MRINLLRFIVALASIFISVKSQSQCLVSSSGCGGYTVQVSITPTSIVPSSLTCPFGYNYNVTFNYSITVSGANNCFNGNIGVQPQIFCNSQNNGYYTILVPAPTVGTPSTNTYTGTLTTTTNPYNSATDCGSSTVSSLNCNSIDITIYGPGINATTINCNNPNNTIATANISGSPFCAGATLSVPYTVNGTFTSGNVFTAQLSNASGSFASPTNIGSVSSTTSGTITAVIPTATATGSGYRIRVVSSNPAITGTNNGSNLTINAALVPSVSIGVTSGANPACVGSSVTFTATPTNGGAGPSYQWTKNGVNIGGATASTYTGVAGTDFVSGDLIRCVLTSNATCVNPTTATSAAITMTVTPSTSIFYITGVTDLAGCFRAEEKIVWNSLSNMATTGSGNGLIKTTSNNNWDGGAFSYNQVFNNGYLEFTATETNTDRMIGLSNTNTNSSFSSIRYAIGLRSNGVIDIYENNSYRGTFGTYATNDVFRVSVESNIVKYYKNNTLLFTSSLTPTTPLFADVSFYNINGTIANPVIANLTTGSFSSSLTNGAASSYNWKLNGSPVGTNSSTYSNSSITVSDIITCDLVYNSVCATPTISSNSIRIINGIGSPALISIGANPSTTNCQGTSVTFTATPTNGGASPSYQWTKNGVNIGGATASTYTGVAGTDFVSGDLIRCVLTSNATCASPAVVTSAPITMTVTPQVTPTISISQNNANICSSGISFTSTISNGGVTPAYQWFINNIAVGGANASTFTPANPVNGSQVTCQLASSLTCVTAATVTSNAVTLSITGPVTTWLGTSNSWNSATNWSSGIPNSNLRAIIPTAVPNQPLITTAAVVFDVLIDAGATLTIGAGGSLDVHNDFVNNGTFNAGVSTVSFLTCGGNNQQHNIAGSTVTTFNNITLNNTAGLSLDIDANLIGELNLTNGTFTNSASTFTLVSNAAGTARIAPVAATANFVGNITMQRFAPGPNTGWAH
ncbi:MAG: beta strand repeat-containing protein, partial [Bacteroidota bacterium]